MGSTSKMSAPDFFVRLVGEGISPSVVPVRALARILESVQRLIEQRNDDEVDDDTEKQKKLQTDPTRTLHLLKITKGSAQYAVSGANRASAINVLSSFGKSIQSPKRAEWTDSVLSSVKGLSEVAKTMGCQIEFRDSDKGVIAKITPQTYQDISSTAFIRARTSVYATIERVGGATAMHCGIRLPDAPRKMVICRVVDEKLVRRLGQYMYQRVLVSGRATWNRHNWRLRWMTIDSFEPPKTGSIMETLDAAYEAGGRAWDAIKDPDAFLAEMRGS